MVQHWFCSRWNHGDGRRKCCVFLSWCLTFSVTAPGNPAWAVSGKKKILLVRLPLPSGSVAAWEGPRAYKWLKKAQIAKENHFSYSMRVIWDRRRVFWTCFGAVTAAPKFAADSGITFPGPRQKLEPGRASNTSGTLERQQHCLCIPWQEIPSCEKISHSPTMAWVGSKTKMLTGEVLSAVFPA